MYTQERKRFDILLDKVDIVSFDIFDTLLIRPYLSPEDLFQHIEEYCKFEGFKHERQAAEKRARFIKKECEDITINDIYNNICPQFAHLKTIEMELEKQVLRPNPYIKDFYDKAATEGKTIIAISDMYLPADFLKEILTGCGFDKIAEVFVSGEYKQCKGSKNLYKEAITKLNVKPEKILHIGDNPQSDYIQALACGCKAIHIEKYTNKFFKTKNGKRYLKLLKNNKNLDLSIITSIAALPKDKENYWYNLGYCFGGPFAVGYVQYIMEQCKLNDINNLLFVSRDGYILQKVYRLLAGNNALENHYVYAPRILNLKCFLDYRDNFTYLKSIFELNCDICPAFHNIPKSFNEAKTVFQNNIKHLQERVENNLKEYLEYINKQNITNTRIATVDMTTGAFSSQAFLTNIFKENLILGFFSGSFADNVEFKYKTFINKLFTAEEMSKFIK